MSALPTSWLPYANGGEARLRLFCFPHSGAAAAMYRPWVGALGPRVQVCPVELPGHGTRIAEPLARRLAPLVAETAAALRPYLDRPYAIFGHSMGALLGFELARSLAGSGGPAPEHLFASGHEAPQLASGRPPVHCLPEEEFAAELRRLGGTPDDVFGNEELRRLLFPILRADFEACETYVFGRGARLACPITALAGLSDPFVSQRQLEAWLVHTEAAFDMQLFAGDHFYLIGARAQLLAVLDHHLASVQSEPVCPTY
jgi:medium-chain acyl-[acyl-carrier-protein] hydrolase